LPGLHIPEDKSDVISVTLSCFVTARLKLGLIHSTLNSLLNIQKVL